VSPLVSSCSTAVGSTIVGSALGSAIVIVTGSTTLSSSVGTLLLSSVRLVVLSASAGKSTGVASSGNDRWDAGAADIVGDHIGLGRKGGGCYGVEHAIVGAVDETKEEGQAAWVTLAWSSTVGSSG
jgi:hypothetical protein